MGRRIAAGQPVLTVFAQAASLSACLDALRQQVGHLDRWLYRR